MLKHPTHLKGQFVCHGPCRRWVGYGIAGFLVLVVLMGFFLTRPQRLAGFAKVLLQDATGADVTIASATLDWNGTLQLHDLTMTLPDTPDDAGRLFDVQRVQMTQDLWSLLSGNFRATSITLIQPTAYITKDPASDTYNFQLMPPKPPTDDKPGPKVLPTIYLREGRIVFATRHSDGATAQIGTVHLSGSLLASGGASKVYTLQLREDRAAGETGLAIAGQYDIDSRAIEGTMTDFHFDGVIRDALPERVLDVWNQLDPQGSIPLLRFAHSPEAGFAVELHLENMALRVAHGDIDERLRHARGKFVFLDDQLNIDALTGELLGGTIAVNGWVRTDTGRMTNLLSSATGDITIDITDFNIPQDKSTYLQSLPGIVQRNIERFDPAGPVSVSVRIARSHDASPEGGFATRVEGHADLHGISGRYFRFPYRVHDAHGRVAFSNDAVTINNVTGVGSTGTKVTLDGSIAPPGNGAEVDIRVTASDVPVDEQLLAALGDKHRDGVEQLFDHERYDALRAAGRVQTHADRATALAALEAAEQRDDVDAAALAALQAKADVPVFELGGRVSASAHVYRPLGPDKPYTTTVDIDPVGLGVIYDKWKYPVRVTGGAIQVNRGVFVKDVTFAGLSGAQFVADGVIADADKFNVGDTLLTIRGDRMPLDDWLRGTINDAARKWLDILQLDTTLAMVCHTYVTDEHKVAFKVDATFEGGSANPWDAGYVIDEVRGKATVERDLFTLHELTGKHDASSIAVNGSVQWREEAPAVSLHVKGANLAIEPQLLALAQAIDSGAASLVTLRDSYDAKGTFDVDVQYTLKPDGSNARQIAVQPRTVTLRVDDTPVALTDMAGTLRLVGPGAVLDGLSGALEGGRLSASGQITWMPETQVDLKLDYADGCMSNAVRALLPTAAQAVVDGMEIAGGVSLQDGHLRISEKEVGRSIAFDGKVGFKDATAAIGLPADRINGVLTVAINREADATLPAMKLDLAADSLHVSDRRVTKLAVAMSTTEDRRTLTLTRMDGEVYGGVLVGAGTMDLARDRMLRLELSIQDVAFEPFIAAGRSNEDRAKPARAEQPAADMPPGVLSAGLTFEAVPGDVASRRGRGAMRVRNARLYDLPVTLAMLQIANLTLPTSRAFDRMQATYMLDGDVLTIEKAELTASNVALLGAGHVRLSDRRVDLAFVSRNPEGGIDLGLIGDLLHGIKDELVTIHLTGTLTDPHIGLDSFRRVRESWSSIFSQKKASAGR